MSVTGKDRCLTGIDDNKSSSDNSGRNRVAADTVGADVGRGGSQSGSDPSCSPVSASFDAQGGSIGRGNGYFDGNGRAEVKDCSGNAEAGGSLDDDDIAAYR